MQKRERRRSHGRLNPTVILLILILAGMAVVAVWWYGEKKRGRVLSQRKPLFEQKEKPFLSERGRERSERRESRAEERDDSEELASAFLEDRLADVAEAASPAVVNIFTEKKVRPGPAPRFFEDPLFRRFFGPDFPGPPPGFPPGPGPMPKENALGSGVIVTPDGYILTNHHVIEEAEAIKIALSDKREFEARVIGSDPETDIAVLKIEGEDLPTLPFGDSDKVRVGQVVLAIGNPFGLSHTVTMGIVSARGRSQVGIADYEDFLQTDAAINPGNSGGALINLAGELIGINTAIFSRTGGYEGIGFAIPSNQAKKIMDDLIAHGTVTRGWLGVELEEFTPEVARALGLKGTKGALVRQVLPGTPAEKAGLEPGDVILSLEGKEIAGVNDLRNRIAATPPGSEVELGIMREGEELTLEVKLGTRPSREALASAEQGRPPGGASGEVSFVGMKVAELTEEVIARYGIENPVPGVVVILIEPQGRAANSALAEGDIIYRMNRQDIRSLADFRNAAEKAGDGPVLLQVKRGAASLFIVIPRE